MALAPRSRARAAWGDRVRFQPRTVGFWLCNPEASFSASPLTAVLGIKCELFRKRLGSQLPHSK